MKLKKILFENKISESLPNVGLPKLYNRLRLHMGKNLPDQDRTDFDKVFPTITSFHSFLKSEGIEVILSEITEESEPKYDNLHDLKKAVDPLLEPYDLSSEVNHLGNRLDIYGLERNKFAFGMEHHGKKFGPYQIFSVDDDDRGTIVRVVKL